MGVSEKLPSYQFFHCVGNAPVEEAEVVLLTEVHNDSRNKELNARIIDAFYRPGDLVLVESIGLGQVVNPKTIQKFACLSQPVEVVGWDHGKAIEACDKLRSELDENIMDIKKLCFDLRYQSSRGRRETIVDKIIPIAKKIDPNFCIHEDLEPKSKLYSEFEEMQRFRGIAQDILKRCERARTYRFFYEGVGATWDIRNDSLCTALQTFAKKDRRIFLIAGRAHIFPTHQDKNRGFSRDLSIQKVQDTFDSAKFVIFDDRRNELPDHFLRPGWKWFWGNDNKPRELCFSARYPSCRALLEKRFSPLTPIFPSCAITPCVANAGGGSCTVTVLDLTTPPRWSLICTKQQSAPTEETLRTPDTNTPCVAADGGDDPGGGGSNTVTVFDWKSPPRRPIVFSKQQPVPTEETPRDHTVEEKQALLGAYLRKSKARTSQEEQEAERVIAMLERRLACNQGSLLSIRTPLSDKNKISDIRK